MDEPERAKLIAAAIYAALGDVPAPAAAGMAGCSHVETSPPLGDQRFRVTRRGGCVACDPGACWVCGYLFTGERISISHVVKGERVISDRTLHLLTHGITRYQTRYVVYGEPVVVDLALDELAGYLDM
jgi:hypothetical protein